ncbi:Crp/Fnr family transcriptional regulator [Clostridium sp. DL1XJH146]
MEIEKYISELKNNKLFNHLSEEEIERYFIQGYYQIKSYKKNALIRLEGEHSTTLDIILKGTIIVQKIDEKGNVLTIADFKKGDDFGGNLIFSNYPIYPMSIIAKENVILLHLKKELILNLCSDNKDFLVLFLNNISNKSAILSQKIKSISLKSIRESIIDFLKYEYNIQNSSVIKLELSKKELAEKMGIQRTSLSRELNKMRKNGMIKYDAHNIELLNLDFIQE